MDVNDNIPSFNQESYQVTISEEVEVGTVVVRLFATDEDSGENGRIRYEIMDATESKFYLNYIIYFQLPVPFSIYLHSF